MREAEAATGGTPARRARTPAIWIFLSLDCASFGLFFIVFMAERMAQPALFDASAQQLDARLGFLNACILITSSWLVAWAARVGRPCTTARGARPRRARTPSPGAPPPRR